MEELKTPAGFVTAKPMEIEVKMQKAVQQVTMADDHTRIQIRKYEKAGGKEVLLNGAVFSLYTGNQRQSPVYTFTTDDGKRFREFIPEFEEMYQIYGARKGNTDCP